jgi:glycosyltransferase involved in cell wall biosynthesis
MFSSEVIKVYVGADRSQALAIPVLEHSIKRHTTAKVEVIPMLDLPVPSPLDPRNSQRTGFSFSRFCIPKLANYRGKAIYMDADMLVFKDIRELWDIPFDDAKVVIQQEVKFADITTQKIGAPKKRKKQCAVMLLNCEALDWDIETIVAGMDAGKYDYEQLMYDLCILDESEVKYGVPFEWNSLEHWDAETRLIHYTDVYTQPWTACGNPYGHLWLNEVRHMLANRQLDVETLKKEIDLGYLRPSLTRDLRYRHLIPSFLQVFWDKYNAVADKHSGYIPHKEVYEAKRIRQKAIKTYEAKLQDLPIPSAINTRFDVGDEFEIFLGGNASAKNVLIFTEHVNATYFISFDSPLRRMHANGEINFAVASQAHVAAQGVGCWERWVFKTFRPDLVIMTRYGQPHGMTILEFFKNNKVPVIYHIDDNLLELPASLGAEIQQRQGAADIVETRRQLLANCDLIYASTTQLTTVLKQRFPQQRFAHGIYASYQDITPAFVDVAGSQQPVIGYMGSKGHQHDLELAVPALVQLLEERSTLRFEIFGTIRMPAALERFGSRVRSHSVQKSYTEFLCSLAGLGWTIGLAPLIDEPFNRCKAPTKYIEYTSCGVPVVATDLCVYADVIPPGGGILVTDNWYAALTCLLDDPVVQKQIVTVAKQHCSQVFSSEKLQNQLTHIFESVQPLEIK